MTETILCLACRSDDNSGCYCAQLEGPRMTASTLTLADFLLARIAEDERHARKLAEHDSRPVLSLAVTVNHPQRVLAECEAKRRIVARTSTNLDGFPWHQAVLAEVYADHPDYREEWAL